jgi:D-beta-D-heptose 7-phosphate kinase / D-beta-D-heptose 1-phosphate adenosyltransferase
MSLEPLVVVGDSLLDVDIEGTADRLSPEAPVPVVDAGRCWHRPGGAGLAALLAAESNPDVVLITAIASDDAGAVLLDLFAGRVDVRPLPLRGSTICKTRISAAGLPMLRLDTGDGRAEASALSPPVIDALANAGTILVSDYGRGMTAIRPLRELISRQAGRIPVVWDPHPSGDQPVRGCALVTPNAAEAQRFSRSTDPADQGSRLCAQWHAGAVAVTRGDRGATLTLSRSGRTTVVPLLDGRPAVRGTTRPDTCGAGDMFAAAVAEELRNGVHVEDAVRSAVSSAAKYVEAGAALPYSTASVDRDHSLPGADRSRTDALRLAARVRRSGGRLVATGGCFDLLHPGHVNLLERARGLGDALIVCLNSDSSIRQAKGPGRPLVAQEDRARVLGALAAVDGVVIFDEPTPAAVLGRLRPDVWVKGEDYADRPMPEAEVVRRHGGEIVLLPLLRGYSTTRLVHAASRSRPSHRAVEPVRVSQPQEAS